MVQLGAGLSLSGPLSLSCRSPCIFVWSSCCTSVCPIPFLIWKTHFETITSVKTLPSNKSHSEILGVGLRRMNWGRRTVHSLADWNRLPNAKYDGGVQTGGGTGAPRSRLYRVSRREQRGEGAHGRESSPSAWDCRLQRTRDSEGSAGAARLALWEAVGITDEKQTPPGQLVPGYNGVTMGRRSLQL